MRIYERDIQAFVETWLFKGRMILIFGPRQAGKTTFAKNFLESWGKAGAYFNCEHTDVRSRFVLGEPDRLRSLTEGKKVVVFDEAQTIKNIGRILKTYWDTYGSGTQIIATGSSSFDLANKIVEPMTGRIVEGTLPPLSLAEIAKTLPVTIEMLHDLLRFGSYPAIVDAHSADEKSVLLRSITTNYLYKDVYMLESLRNPKLLEDLLRALALQVGNIVSMNELAETVGSDRKTVARYLRLLEQAYVVFRLNAFSRNPRNEIRKAFKVYFWDVGIRNAVIGNLSPIEGRADRGALFENFFIVERMKLATLMPMPPQFYFWRTRKGMEIDLLEETSGVLNAYECKWSDQPVSFRTFLKNYPGSQVSVVTPQTTLANVPETPASLAI